MEQSLPEYPAQQTQELLTQSPHTHEGLHTNEFSGTFPEVMSVVTLFFEEKSFKTSQIGVVELRLERIGIRSLSVLYFPINSLNINVFIPIDLSLAIQ